MYEWIESKLAECDENPDIVWRVAVQHHPLFGKTFHQDNSNLIFNY